MLHTSISPEKIKKVETFSNAINIKFQEIIISGKDLEGYNCIRDLSLEGVPYPAEAYFDLCPHLPSYVDRAIYFDAGDVIVSGDISVFYFADFKGNVLLPNKGWGNKYKHIAQDLFEKFDYVDLTIDYLNSGSGVYNLDLMRQLKIDFNDYISINDDVKISNGAIIKSNSNVTENVPPFAVVLETARYSCLADKYNVKIISGSSLPYIFYD